MCAEMMVYILGCAHSTASGCRHGMIKLFKVTVGMYKTIMVINRPDKEHSRSIILRF